MADQMHTAKLRPLARHSPIWEFTCHAPVGAPCRLVCVEGCDGVDPQNHVHELSDCGVCQYIICLKGGGDAVYTAPSGEFVAWEGPVKIVWEDGHYEFTPLDGFTYKDGIKEGKRLAAEAVHGLANTPYRPDDFQSATGFWKEAMDIAANAIVPNSYGARR